MDIKLDLDHVLGKVIEAQRDAGYMESTIGQTMVAVRAISALAAERGQTVYTKELGATFAAMTTSPKTGAFSMRRKRLYGRLARLCDSYADTGTVNLGTMKRTSDDPGLASEEFVALFDGWREDMASRGLAKNTQDYYGRLSLEFLRFLETRGVFKKDDIQPEAVASFVVHLKATSWKGTSVYHLASNFRPFVNHLGRRDLLAAFGLLDLSRAHNIIPALEDADQQAMITACCCGAVSRRDAAIVLLALSSGIRACDIISLRLEDIDWKGRAIAITQQKTGNPLTIPLLPAVGNALCDYILDERPESLDKHVFLGQLAPHRKLAGHSTVYKVIGRVQRKAGVEGAPCGTMALRHNAATRMLRAGTGLPTISAVLGHADPASSDAYIETDRERMAACVLPLPGRGSNGGRQV